MKTLPREAGKPAPEKEEVAPAPAPAWPAGSFTARELDAAQQLVLLSGSSTSTGTATTPSAAGPAASGSSSSSVNAPPPAPAPAPTPATKAPLPAAENTVVVQEERGQQWEMDWEQPMGHRYRLIAEIYEVTEEIE